MIILGKVKEIASTFLKAVIFGNSDVRTATQTAPFGIDSKPVKDSFIVYCQTDNNQKAVMLGCLSKSDKTKAGELRLFATDSEGVEVFSMLFKNDGTCEFGGNSDNLVRYSELNSGLSNQNSAINTELAKIQTALTSIGGAYARANVGLNISSSKIAEIKTL